MSEQRTKANAIAIELLGQGLDELTDREKIVVSALAQGRSISSDTNADFADQSSFWQKMADMLARGVGSWPFIFAFLVFLVGWMALNIILLSR